MRGRYSSLAMSLAEAADSERGLAVHVTSLIGKLKVKDPKQRLELVQRLLGIEADMTAANNRIAMLTAAIGVAGKHSSHARGAAVGRLRERLGAADNEVANAAKELLGAAGEPE